LKKFLEHLRKSKMKNSTPDDIYAFLAIFGEILKEVYLAGNGKAKKKL